jgi:tRNA-dihydrouridine synthase A
MNKESPYIAVAPMMDWTDRHCRYFHRLISPNTHLFTEMVTTGALIHGDLDRHLRFNDQEHPVTLQLGGNNPDDLARCTRIAQDYGYDAVNLNCGCPSDRVKSGAFGACLMKDPELVARCIEEMISAAGIPVSVKCRISIDEYEERSFLTSFINHVSKAGCKEFIIHARKAWLNGLSPKENRTIPPLDYELVAEIKAAYPSIRIILNGGITTLDEVECHLKTFDGVQIMERLIKPLHGT